MTKRPYVSGKLVRDTNGARLTMVGVIKHKSLWYYANSASWIDETEAVYDLIQGSGARIVHLSMNRWHWDNNRADFIAGLDSIIAKCKARGLYVILQWGYWTRDLPATSANDIWTREHKVQYIQEYNSWESFILGLANIYKDEPTVIGFEPFKEPSPKAENWATIGLTLEQGKALWEQNQLRMINAIHAVDPSYIVIAYPLDVRFGLPDFQPYIGTPNVVYGQETYYQWDIGLPYANAYNTATTEAEFQQAYELMQAYFLEYVVSLREAHGVPVGVFETSIGRIDWQGNPVNNAFQQFSDEMKILGKYGVSNAYWSCDRDSPSGKHWKLLKSDDASQWNEAGTLWNTLIQQYFKPTPISPLRRLLPLALIAGLIWIAGEESKRKRA